MWKNWLGKYNGCADCDISEMLARPSEECGVGEIERGGDNPLGRLRKIIWIGWWVGVIYQPTPLPTIKIQSLEKCKNLHF